MGPRITSPVSHSPQPDNRPSVTRRKTACFRCRKKKISCVEPRNDGPCQTCIDKGVSELCTGSVPTDAKLEKQRGGQKLYVHVSVQTQKEPSGFRIYEERSSITLPQSITHEQDERLSFPPNSIHYPIAPSSGQVHNSSTINGEYCFEDGQALGNNGDNHMTVASSPQRSIPQRAFDMGAYYSSHTVYSADPTYQREFVSFETPQGHVSGSSHGAFVEGSSRGCIDPRYLSKH